MPWLDINDAPPDVLVKLERYEAVSWDDSAPLKWRVDVGKAFETIPGFLWRKRVRKTYDAQRFTHYKPIPTPPGDANA